MNRLMLILYQAIDKGVYLSDTNEEMVQSTLNDHRMIMEFLSKRDSEGARTAMKLHIIHAMRGTTFFSANKHLDQCGQAWNSDGPWAEHSSKSEKV